MDEEEEEEQELDATSGEGEEGEGVEASNSRITDRIVVITRRSSSAREDRVTTCETARGSSCRRSWRTHGRSWKLLVDVAMGEIKMLQGRRSMEEDSSRERRCVHDKCSSMLQRTDLGECSFNRRFWRIRGCSWCVDAVAMVVVRCQ